MSDLWMRRAACLGKTAEADVTFDHPGRPEAVVFGQKYCSGCPVAGECLRFAMDAEAGLAGKGRFGVYGGLSGVDRGALVKWGRRPCVGCGARFIARNRVHVRCSRCGEQGGSQRCAELGGAA